MNDSISDDELIYVLKRGNQIALNVLYKKYNPIISKWVSYFNLDSGYKEFAIEACGILLNRCIECYDNTKGNFSSYFKTACCNYLKRLSIENRRISSNNLFIDSFDILDNGFKLNEDVETTLDYNENHSLENKVQNLRSLGLTYKQIAERLNINFKKVDNIIQKLRKKEG